MAELKRTPLYDAHMRLGARMVDFAGWEMPIQYEGISVEHEAVRTCAGMFDVSHMGEVEFTGSDALEYLQNLVTNDVSSINDNQMLYTFMCYPNGGVVDDIIVYRRKEDSYMAIINASNIDKDIDWMREQVGSYDVEIKDRSGELSLIALQGPKAEEILGGLVDVDLKDIGFFQFSEDVKCASKTCMISRSGYTGEDGFEICLRNEDALFVWEKLMEIGTEKGLKPCGLGARDTLRFEANLPLYGNELSERITPLEAGFGMFVKLDKGGFIGRDALKRQKEEGLTRKIVGFEMVENGIPRHGYDVLSDGKVIGFVTTGYNSPTLKKNIGLAMVDIQHSALGSEICIQVRKKVLQAKVIKRRFYTKSYKK
ncbi:MAG: glycine cleavage system aminomethyltransferase GcvT [Eubacteriales bacterium]